MRLLVPLLALLLSLAPPLPLAAQPSATPYGVTLSVSLPGRPSFPRDGLAEVGITLKNVSRRDVRLAVSPCPRSPLDVEELDRSGRAAAPPFLLSPPVSPCPEPTPGPPIHPGQTVSGGGFVVLRTDRIRPVAQLWIGGKPVLVRGPAIPVKLHTGKQVEAIVHTDPALYVDVRPSTQSFSLTYKYWYTCVTASGERVSEVHPREPLYWLYGQGPYVHPRFRSDCRQVLEWHAVAAFLFEPVVTVDDTKPYALPAATSPPPSPASGLTPRRQILQAFETLRSAPHVVTSDATRYRIQTASRDIFTTEISSASYLAPDRLLTVSHGLSPVGRPQTLTFLQVGPAICSKEPYNYYPPGSWRSYPYDLFVYHNHRPDFGRTELEGLGLPIAIGEPITGPSGVSATLAASPATVVIGGQSLAATAIRMHFRYPVGEHFPYQVRYRGHVYFPRTGDQSAVLLVDATTDLPLQFSSTSTVTISTGAHVTVEKRQVAYSYNTVPSIELPSQPCG